MQRKELVNPQELEYKSHENYIDIKLSKVFFSHLFCER